MKISSAGLYFFSPTGSTKKIANSILKGMDVYKINTINLTVPENRKNFRAVIEEDIAIIAIPVYGEKVPVFLYSCFDNIKGNGKPLILICVYGNIRSGPVLNELYKLFSRNGFIVVGAGEFIGRHSFCNKKLSIAKERPDTNDRIIAETFGKMIKEKLLEADGLTSIKAAVIPQKKLSIIAKIVPNNNERIITKLPNMDINTCQKCGICVKACPMEAIQPGDFTIDGKICIRCFACVRKCPAKSRQIYLRKKLIILPYFKLYGSKRKEPVIYI